MLFDLFGLAKPPKAKHLADGQNAEDCALAYLQAQGLHLVERNYRCRGGEIDLVMADGKQLVFVEVRYRASHRYGGAVASVDGRKQARIVHAATHYLVSKRLDRIVRFDVAAVTPDQGRLAVQWIKDAFRL